MLDQTLYDPAGSPLTVAAFAQYGRADEATNEIKTHASTGLQMNGLMADRPEDMTGLMASYVGFSDRPAAGFRDDYELAIEAFHAIQATHWLTLKPDFQYIVNPGGMGLNDATVVTLRAEITL
ncbi:MAG: hypothetical protein CMN26_16585 [Salinisphaera sp.]|nr:hypothetical protein [Salinisphaera sp.]